MEPNPASRAMEWSVDLEKGLRSKSPLRRAKAISDVAPNLLRWTPPPPAAHHLFDLIPGEHRLLSNAALLRLAAAFSSGDLRTRRAVAELFLSEHRRRKGGSVWLLSKEGVSNSSELLRRIKSVFGDEDFESRSLALGLFGCWAGFAVESSHVRYLVLSSMVSSHVSEAKAALFAAGCFCEASDDFPCVVLEMLSNLMTSSETLPPIRLASARLLAKMGNSYMTATKAYQTGLKLVLESSEEDFQVALLVSLSKIASRSSTLVSDQVNLLFSFLGLEKTMRVRETALKCLHFVFSKGLCKLSFNSDLVEALFIILDETELPTSMKCEALKILHKIILHMQPILTRDLLGFNNKLISVVENKLSPSIGLIAVFALVDISKKHKETRDTDLTISCLTSLPAQVVSLITRVITSLVKPLVDRADSVKFQEINNVLNLLLSVVQENQDFSVLVLDPVIVLVRYLGSMNGENFMDLDQTDTLAQDNACIEEEKSKEIALKVLGNVYRFLVNFLECLNEAGAITIPVFDKVKLLVETVCGSKLIDSYIHTIYSMLLCSRVFWGLDLNKNEESCSIEGKYHMLSHNYSVQSELNMLEFTKIILADDKNWTAYKVGTHLACQGRWFSSSLIFQHLITQVSSDSSGRWLRSLFHFVCAERKTVVLLQAERLSSLAGTPEATRLSLKLLCNDLEEIGHGKADIHCQSNCSKVVLSAYNSICSAKETLEMDLTNKSFIFQRWFLSLRAKALQAVVDVFGTLENIPFLWEVNGTNWEVEKKLVVKGLLSLGQVSSRFMRLAKEFDLLRTSFIDMDRGSSNLISAIALNISLLAFIAGFSFFIPTEPETSTYGLENSKNTSLCAHLVQNLAGRLWHLDHETSTKLCQLVDVGEDADVNCFHLQFRDQALNVDSEARDILSLCSYAVSEIACLISNAVTTHSNNTPPVVEGGLKLTLKLLIQHMQIPFRIPKYFFRLRPCIGSELFAISVNKNPDAIRVLPGYHLPLSLCLQLRNVPSGHPLLSAKLYCVLYCSSSFHEPRSDQETTEQSQAWETDDMVELDKKLVLHVKNSFAKNIENAKSSTQGSDDRGLVTSFVCCKPSETGQCLGSCLLDVSRFPIGLYRIKWLSCCVDKDGNYWNLLPLNAGPVFTIE